jgi:hypothetical protein
MTATPTPHNWSRAVSEHSNALDLEPGVFTWDDPARIARSLQHSADSSLRRKRDAYASAMARLVLERSKVELRRLYGRG